MERTEYNIVALFGKAGSGKDYILNTITEKYPSLYRKISCTNRPKRDYEQDGVDYHFVSSQEFMNLIKDLVEAECFNNWWYGTRITDLKPAPAINIGIFNIEGITNMMTRDDPSIQLNVLPIFIRCLDKTRIIRQLQREKDPDIEEILRRFQSDKKDYRQTIRYEYDTVRNQEETDINKVVKEVAEIIEKKFGKI